MAAVLTPCASSAARSPGMRETTQICGRRESMLLVGERVSAALSWRKVIVLNPRASGIRGAGASRAEKE